MKTAAMLLGIVGGALGILSGMVLPLIYPFLAGLSYGGSGFNQDGSGTSSPETLTVGLGLLATVVLAFLCGVGGIVGGALTRRHLLASRILLLVCGAVGFIIGLWWILPGVLLLVAGGLQLAAKGEKSNRGFAQPPGRS